ncbi:endonuclease, partial [bacterium]|nr:endonuclease [bacterium]
PCESNPCTEENRTTCVATGNEIGMFSCSCDNGYVLENGVCVVQTVPTGCLRYQSALDLSGNELKIELRRLTGLNYDGVGYSSARDYMYDDIDNVSGKGVQCVYTGLWNNSINCEHTWPQSMGAEGDAKSDIHHLFPTNSSVNSSRGNLPFGVAVSDVDTYCNDDDTYCSKRGDNSNGTTIFEPADQHKGDVARAMFYFAIRYNNPSNFINTAGQAQLFKEWNQLDPVSQKELDRNDSIERIQNNRNPFVDCPMLIDRVSF